MSFEHPVPFASQAGIDAAAAALAKAAGGWSTAESPQNTAADMVNHPPHYTSDPSGVECIEITRHRTFNIGNAIKYLWRAGLKTSTDVSNQEKELEDLRKAVWYINDEISRLQKAQELTQ